MSLHPVPVDPAAADPLSAAPVAADIAAAARALALAGVPSPAFDSQCLAAHVLAAPRAELALQEVWPHDQARADFFDLVRRRECREPLQHLTGSAPFRWLDVLVGPGVFIPRPETELVAGAAIDAARLVRTESHRVPIVVDLFAGSGAIALAVATEVPGCTVIAVEGEPEAVTWLRRNVAHLGPAQPGGDVDIPTIRVIADWVESLAQVAPDLMGCVDIVVANPPYLRDDAQLSAEVAQFDPPSALFGGADGLAGPQLAVKVAESLLRPGGVVIIEHDDSHGDPLPALMRASGQWEHVAGHADLSGRPRYVTAQLSNPTQRRQDPQRGPHSAVSAKHAEVNQ